MIQYVNIAAKWLYKITIQAFLFVFDFVLCFLEIIIVKAKKAVRQTRKQKGFYTDFEMKYTIEQLLRLALLIPNYVPLTYGKIDAFFEYKLSKNTCYKIIEIAETERKTRKPVFQNKNSSFMVDLLGQLMKNAEKAPEKSQ